MTQKTCTKCGETKDAGEFSKRKALKSGLRSQCKSCDKGYSSYYKTAHADRILKQRGEYRRSDSGRAVAHEYYEKNKEKILRYGALYYRKNKRWISLRNAEYMQANRDAYNAHAAKRRAVKLQATPAWANEGYIKLFYEGAKIEEKRTGRKVHVDHTIPLQGKNVCGLHCEDNLQLMFAEDNIMKSNKF